MTKREMYEAIKVAVADNAEMVAFCDHEIELLGKKRTNKPTKTQEANEVLKERIVEILADATEPMRVGDIVKALKDESITSQKVSALMRQLKEAGRVTKVTEKKVSTFSLA